MTTERRASIRILGSSGSGRWVGGVEAVTVVHVAPAVCGGDPYVLPAHRGRAGVVLQEQQRVARRPRSQVQKSAVLVPCAPPTGAGDDRPASVASPPRRAVVAPVVGDDENIRDGRELLQRGQGLAKDREAIACDDAYAEDGRRRTVRVRRH